MKTFLINLISISFCHFVFAFNLPHQGRVSVNGKPFSGLGEFRFALVNDSGAVVWNNDGQTGEPLSSIKLQITGGFYSYVLKDIPPSLFQDYQDLKLRIWFDDGKHGLFQLGDDQPLPKFPYSVISDFTNDPRVASNRTILDPLQNSISGAENSILDLNKSLNDLLLNQADITAFEDRISKAEALSSAPGILPVSITREILENLVKTKELSNADFTIVGDADMENLDFTSSLVDQAKFTNKNVSNSDFSNANVSSGDFTGATANGVNFTDSNLTNSNFSNGDVSNSDFSNANVSSGDFTGATAKSAKFIDSNLTSSNFTNGDVSSSDFSNANVSSGDFTGATANGANFTDSNLTNSNFSKATLNLAIFSNSILDNSNFTDVNSIPVSLSEAKSVKNIDFTNAKFLDWNTNALSKLDFLGSIWDTAELNGYKFDSNANLSTDLGLHYPNNFTNFSNASLEATDFSDLNLIGVIFNEVDFVSEGKASVFTNVNMAESPLSDWTLLQDFNETETGQFELSDLTPYLLPDRVVRQQIRGMKVDFICKNNCQINFYVMLGGKKHGFDITKTGNSITITGESNSKSFPRSQSTSSFTLSIEVTDDFSENKTSISMKIDGDPTEKFLPIDFVQNGRSLPSDWQVSHVSGEVNLDNIELKHKLHGSFRGADLRSANFDGADLTGADFTDAKLTNATFIGSNLTNVIFTATMSPLDLEGVDFRFATLKNTEFYKVENYVKGANTIYSNTLVPDGSSTSPTWTRKTDNE